MKPHIRRGMHISSYPKVGWFCSCKNYSGFGYTQRQAYSAWENQKRTDILFKLMLIILGMGAVIAVIPVFIKIYSEF